MAPAFDLYGAAHLGALGLTLALAILLVRHARRHPETTRRVPLVLAILLLVQFPIQLLVGFSQGALSRENLLPCQLCDIAALLGAAALLTRKQRLAELVWFWGMAGTLNGLITPALGETFPSFRYFAFFAQHSGVVITAVYLVAGLRLTPQPGAILRAFGWIQLWLLAAGLANFLTGANYGFLRAKPDQASLLDLLGPWPYYIIALEGLALLLFALLYLPFRRRTKSSVKE